MEQQAQTFASSSYQHTMTYPPPGSFNERISFQNFGRDPSTHRPQGAPMDLVDLWSLEAAPCGSPLSTSSTISHSESVPTPPYTGLPMYDTLDPTFQDSQANSVTRTNGSDSIWPCSYPEAAPWNSQPFVLPCQEVYNYEQRPFELPLGFQPQPNIPASSPYLPYPESLQYHMEQPVGSATVKPESPSSNGDDSDDLSDSDSDDSWYDGSASSHTSSHQFMKRSRAKPNVFKLEGWSTNMCAFHTTADRKHACTVLIGPNKDIPCPKRFQRPEHLRRHIKTVHRIDLGVLHRCKVPSCGRPFPRSDNLRSHYVTHLKPGKRKGNNEKMTFQRMKEILGPKEKPLHRWLKMKLKEVSAAL